MTIQQPQGPRPAADRIVHGCVAVLFAGFGVLGLLMVLAVATAPQPRAPSAAAEQLAAVQARAESRARSQAQSTEAAATESESEAWDKWSAGPVFAGERADAREVWCVTVHSSGNLPHVMNCGFSLPWCARRRVDAVEIFRNSDSARIDSCRVVRDVWCFTFTHRGNRHCTLTRRECDENRRAWPDAERCEHLYASLPRGDASAP